MSRDAGLLLDRGGAVALPADGHAALLGQWLVWHHDPAVRARAGQAARYVVQEGRGAAERTTALVWELVEERPLEVNRRISAGAPRPPLRR